LQNYRTPRVRHKNREAYYETTISVGKHFLLVVGIFAFGETQKELTALWFYDDPSELEFLNKKAAEYSKLHPGVTIKVNTVAYDDLFPRLTQLIAGNNPPDIVKLTDIRPEIEPFVLDLSKYAGKDFLKPFIPGVAAASIEREEFWELLST